MTPRMVSTHGVKTPPSVPNFVASAPLASLLWLMGLMGST